MIDALLLVLLFLTSIFLILLVLVQRGRGGGLAGAFGGMGGQSAFGTKAGDLFTRITIFTAAFWIILCAFSVKWFAGGSSALLDTDLGRSAAAPETTGTGAAGKLSEPIGGASGPAKAPAADDEANGEAPAASAPAGDAAPGASSEAAPAADESPAKDE